MMNPQVKNTTAYEMILRHRPHRNNVGSTKQSKLLKNTLIAAQTCSICSRKTVTENDIQLNWLICVNKNSCVTTCKNVRLLRNKLNVYMRIIISLVVRHCNSCSKNKNNRLLNTLVFTLTYKSRSSFIDSSCKLHAK